MSGHSDSNVAGNPILWPDASLERIEVGYDECVIIVQEESSRGRKVRCLGYIGFQIIGFWDETIIERATVLAIHPFIRDCEWRLKTLPPSGSALRANNGNSLLEIAFIDGCKLWVCGSTFAYE